MMKELNHTFQTERLLLSSLSLHDNDFIFELVNTPGWIRFIGDRNIHSREAAKEYINRILSNEKIRYWVVQLPAENCSIGIITFIQRDYLPHPDIGFAFLPRYGKSGYASEATKAVLDSVQMKDPHSTILATTIPENQDSIRLLMKLGFHFQEEKEVDGKPLRIYSFRK
jgi:RimJ/RimL family protein N-acetyltransferase